MTSVCARIIQTRSAVTCVQIGRTFSSTSTKHGTHYKLVVVGGGTGGCAVSARACRVLGKGNVAVIEPAKHHYYQPLWTLVGAGIRTVDQSVRSMEDVLPKECHHHKQKVVEFDPDKNTVTMDNGEQLSYDYLLIAMGLQLDWHKIEGLSEALENDPMVCSNYSPQTVVKTFPAIQKFQGGEAVFTFPNSPVKCAGAPQKVMYLADQYWRKAGVRDKTNITYQMPLGAIFAVKKYADRLLEIIETRNIQVNFRTSLVSVDHTQREATFQNLDSPTGEMETRKYDFLHAVPPMSTPDVLQNSSLLVDGCGFLDVNKETLQHTKYPNIFGIGDCTTVPTSKTAAAIGAQNKVVMENLTAVIDGRQPTAKYNGYTSCPLVTSYSKCILAEFGFDGVILETFPFDQGKERRTMLFLKKHVMPNIYWTMALNGRWSSSKWIKKIMHLGMTK